MNMAYADMIRGRAVIDSTGRHIGEVEELSFYVDTWRVDALRVKLDKQVTQEIGAPHAAFRSARIDIPTQFIQDVTDTVVLKGPIGMLRTQEATPEQPPPP